MTKVYNTGETDEELRQEYNPDGSNLRKAQLRLLDMAIYLQETARKIGVSCRLDGGNVLGAVRHGGFIPWDGDIDVVVEYKDYKKLARYLKDHPHPDYVFQDEETDPDSLLPWGRLRDLKTEYVSSADPNSREGKAYHLQKFKGLQLDIFPYEGYMIPWLQHFAAKLSCVVYFDLAGKHKGLAKFLFKTLDKVVFPIFRGFGHLFGDKNNYMHTYGAWFYFKFPKDVLVPHKDIQFEGYTFEGPANVDAMLKSIYKDYTTLPPKEKRAVHSSEIRFLE